MLHGPTHALSGRAAARSRRPPVARLSLATLARLGSLARQLAKTVPILSSAPKESCRSSDGKTPARASTASLMMPVSGVLSGGMMEGRAPVADHVCKGQQGQREQHAPEPGTAVSMQRDDQTSRRNHWIAANFEAEPSDCKTSRRNPCIFEYVKFEADLVYLRVSLRCISSK